MYHIPASPTAPIPNVVNTVLHDTGYRTEIHLNHVNAKPLVLFEYMKSEPCAFGASSFIVCKFNFCEEYYFEPYIPCNFPSNLGLHTYTHKT